MCPSNGEKGASSKATRELDEARTRRLREDRELTMSERLAKLHALCLQITSVVGAARKR